MSELNVLKIRKEQLIEERNNVQDRYFKLKQLLQSSNFTTIVPNTDEQCRLKVQCRYMGLYVGILNERLDYFDEVYKNIDNTITESETNQ